MAKPDKGIFEVVQRELGVDPGRRASWSATTRSTTSPARRRAGWRAVWLDRDGAGVPPDAEGAIPDAVVRSLDELPGVLERLR